MGTQPHLHPTTRQDPADLQQAQPRWRRYRAFSSYQLPWGDACSTSSIKVGADVTQHFQYWQENQAHTCVTTAASCSAQARTCNSSSPSTITRNSGSVPDLRSNTRPRPAMRSVISAQATLTAGCSSGSSDPEKRTLINTCGHLRKPLRASASVISQRRRASKTCKPAMIASPVVVCWKQTRCPEFSPPNCQSRANKSAIT